jgi:competence protein ComFC
MQIVNTILEILYPTKCIICQKNNLLLCSKCLSTCSPAQTTFNWIFPVLSYQEIVIKKAIWFFKYKKKKKLALIFGNIIYFKILEELNDLTIFENFVKPILIPIPLSKKSYRKRGFNQSLLICQAIIKINLENNFELMPNVLIKNKETEHQALIKDKQKRFYNLKNTFSVQNKNLIQNRNIILIDDVTTTGATLIEAKKVLLENGARQVIAFTLAH